MSDFNLADYELRWESLYEIMESPQYSEYLTWLKQYGLMQEYEQTCRVAARNWSRESKEFEILSNCTRSLQAAIEELRTKMLDCDIHKEWSLLRKFVSDGSATEEQYQTYRLFNEEIDLQVQLAVRQPAGMTADELLQEIEKFSVISSDGIVSLR